MSDNSTMIIVLIMALLLFFCLSSVGGGGYYYLYYYDTADSNVWTDRGHWVDNTGHTLPNQLLGGAVTTVDKCKAEAIAKGYNVIGLQNGGYCWAGKDLDYSFLGASASTAELGGVSNNHVFTTDSYVQGSKNQAAVTNTPAAGSGVTVNGYTFDPTGYSVSKGWFWDPQTDLSTSIEATAAACKQKCSDNNQCVHWSRAETDGTCTLSKNSTDDTVHVRGIKDPATAGNIQTLVDAISMDKPDKCLSNCNSNPQCIGWVFRGPDHSQAQYKNTCQLHKNDTSKPQFKEGLFNRTAADVSSGSGVTVNGYTFDATGYSVSKGWLGSPDTTLETTYMTTDTQCKDKCISNVLCDHWSRNKASGSCTLKKNNDNESAHERGISSTDLSGGNIQLLRDDYSMRIYTKPDDCIAICKADTNCKAWAHRNSTHKDVNLRNTCILYKINKTDSNQQYVEGLINR